uniref:O-antigen ligase domain-containing protein n=1 Tax=candidate division WWE3 bacterium TaxID=2053526 RepID=A0A7C4XIM8_UNCKA
MSMAHKYIFYLFLALLPLNLGKHFISVDSYVRSRLIDYLIPTIWIQDLLILLLLFMWLLSGGFKKIKKFRYWRILLVLVFSFLPSLVLAERQVSAFYFFLTFCIRLFLFVYVWFEVDLKSELETFIKIFSFQVCLLCLIAIAQWFHQGSFFDNYLFFGEQVYDEKTFNVARTIINGQQKIPVYSIFRHPNIFGGYLSIIFIWFVFYVETFVSKIKKSEKRLVVGDEELIISKALFFRSVYFLIMSLCFIGVTLTFSQFALVSTSLGILAYFLIKRLGRRGVLLCLFVTFVFVVIGFIAPVLTNISSELGQNPSVYRRVNLLYSAYSMVAQAPLWGVGVNNFTVQVPKYVPITQVLSFNQPVHNIFVLIFSENGIFNLLVFLAILFTSLHTLLAQRFGPPVILFINLLQIILIGSFDHYFYTIHQTQLLFLLTVGLSLTYTNSNVKT